MDKHSVMTALNKCEVRLCYGCGEAYNASDFHHYLKSHECKKPFSKKRAFMKLKRGNMKPLNTNKIITVEEVMDSKVDD
jgi:hypothetical protein